MVKLNNKGRRHELTRLKFIKRLKNYTKGKRSGAVLDQYLNSSNKHNMHALKTTGKPCSCYLCSPDKYRNTRAKQKKYEN